MFMESRVLEFFSYPFGLIFYILHSSRKILS